MTMGLSPVLEVNPPNPFLQTPETPHRHPAIGVLRSMPPKPQAPNPQTRVQVVARRLEAFVNVLKHPPTAANRIVNQVQGYLDHRNPPLRMTLQ